MRPVSLLLALASCAPFQGVCTDADEDGTCDPAGGGCPDADDDGVCDADDACPQGSDDADADDDGLADACDACPDDEGGDDDEDGRCGAEDPCPDDPDDACTVPVIVAVQADVFPEDLTWQLVDHRGSLIVSGGFDDPGEGRFTQVEVSPSKQSCLSVRDAGRDGGSRGLVFSGVEGLRYLKWDGDDAMSGMSGCFTPGAGQAFTPPREAAWLDQGACDVVFTTLTGAYPSEIGWQIEKPDGPLSAEGRVVLANPPGSFSQANRTLTKRLTLTDGEWNVRMFDSANDGWRTGGDTAGFSITFVDGPEIVSGHLSGGSMGWQSFTIDCD